MTEQGPAPTVEGGLDEPDELEPAQGSLDLASPEDTATVADWEAAAAAVLRKAKRLGEDDPDALVWQKLTRTTLDGIEVTPLGTPDLLEDRATSGRPTRQGDWDVRALVRADDAKLAHEEALVDLEGGVTSLWLQGSGDTDLDVVLDGVLLDLAPVVLDGIDPAAFLAYAGDRELHPATNLGVPASEATADLAGSGLAGRCPRLRRRRHRGPRPRGLRRPGARLVDGGRGDVPARAHRRRARRRPGRRAGGVPVRRHRRAVRDHRQAPRRAPALGAGPRAQRCLDRLGNRCRRDAAARGHESSDDEQVRPLGEHAAHHGRRVRSRCRGRRQCHRDPVRQPARAPRRVRPPDRPQHLSPADRRVARGARGRPRRRFLRRREAHRRPGRRGVGRLRADRGRRRPRRRDRGDGDEAGGRDRPAQAPDHGTHRVPEPGRGAPRARAGRRPRGASLRRQLRGAARPSRPPSRSSWPPSAASRPTPLARPSPPTSSPPAVSRSTPRARPTASRPCWRRTTASRSSASRAATRRTRSGGPTRSPRCATPAPPT